MTTVRQYTLSDKETERWKAHHVDGEDVRLTMRLDLSAGEPAGTVVQLIDAWGAKVDEWTIDPPKGSRKA